jgi:hypothetical protein
MGPSRHVLLFEEDSAAQDDKQFNDDKRFDDNCFEDSGAE